MPPLSASTFQPSSAIATPQQPSTSTPPTGSGNSAPLDTFTPAPQMPLERSVGVMVEKLGEVLEQLGHLLEGTPANDAPANDKPSGDAPTNDKPSGDAPA